MSSGGGGLFFSGLRGGAEKTHRLSRPHDMSRAGSLGHHDTLRTPCEWPERVASGMVVEERRSHMRMTGFWSSPMAVTRLSPSSGFHATSATHARAASRSSHHGRFCRRSHTMHDPLPLAVATMCATWLFHANAVTSAVCLAVLGGGAGTKTLGVSGRSSDMMYTSLSAPPEASRCDESGCGLNWRPPTGPLCLRTVDTCGCGWPAVSLAGSQMFTTPSAMPPARRPSGCSSVLVAMADHANVRNRPAVFAVPTSVFSSAGSPPAKSNLCSSSSPP